MASKRGNEHLATTSLGALPEQPLWQNGFRGCSPPKTSNVARSCCLVAQSCTPPGSSVHGILQATILESVAISSSRGSSRLRDRTCISCIGRGIIYH